MGEILRMVLVLSCISGLSGLALASLKAVTADKIEEQVLTYVQGPALQQAFTGADNDPIADRRMLTIEGAGKVTVFPAFLDGALAGLAFETFGQGYGGDIGVIVGFDVHNDQLTGIGVTTMKETPGVGALVAEHGFTQQFHNQPAQPEALQLTSAGGNINALTGATYSSTGASAAAQKAARLYPLVKEKALEVWAAPSGGAES